MTALVSPEGHNEANKVDSRLQAMLQDLADRTLDEKTASAEFEELLLRKIEEAIPSRRRVKKVT